jgi:exosome complex RNA-binding protein Rrp42 (RNase PH superfamily)
MQKDQSVGVFSKILITNKIVGAIQSSSLQIFPESKTYVIFLDLNVSQEKLRL